MYLQPCKRLLTFVFLSLCMVAAARGQAYQTVVVFGDSLSDTGNDANLTQAKYTIVGRIPGPAGNYTDGRFTNGTDTVPPARNYNGVWIEQLASTFTAKPAVKDSLDGGTNYAYGFAFTGSGTSPLTFGPNDAFSITINNMGQQVSTYLAKSPVINSQTLFVLWGGANDLLNATSAAQVTAAATQELGLIQTLINAGGTNFMVVNLPPLGLVPRLNGSPATSAPATQAAAVFNQVLASGLAALPAANPGKTLQLYPLDVYALFSFVAGSPASSGLANVTASAQGNNTINPDTYLFWDDLHPTTAGHHLIELSAAALLGTPVATTTQLTFSNQMPALGTTVTATATVTSNSGTAAPMGSVTFTQDGTVVGNGYLVPTGANTSVATATLTAAKVEDYLVQASFSGANGFTGSASPALKLIVPPTAIPTTTALTTSAANVNQGASVTFTATVTGPAGVVPTGSFSFLDGTNVLTSQVPAVASGTNTATATYTTSSLAVGPHSITASFLGAVGAVNSVSPAVTETVTAPALTPSLSPTSLTISRGSTGTDTVTLTPVGGYTGTVTLACGTLPAHVTCSFSPASFTFTASTATQTSTLTIATKDMTTGLSKPFHFGPGTETVLAGLPCLGLLALFRRRRMGSLGVMCVALVMSCGLVALGGCGGSNNTTPSGTYTVPVIVTMGGSSTTLNIALTVQ